MKKCICITLCMVLLFGISSTAIANDTLELEAVETVKRVKPIAYTNDFAAYGNVVGVLNSDGTKTAYLFASAEDAKQIDAITGLVSPGVTPPDVQVQETGSAQPRGSDSSFAIVDAPVYSAYPNQNYGTENAVMIGEDDTLGYGRLYMKFDLSPLEEQGVAYKDVLSACLHFTENMPIETGRESVIQAYLVVNEWDESTITWNNCPDYYGFEMLGCANVGFGEYALELRVKNELYITKAVMAWLQGMYNDGIMLKEKDDKFNNWFFSSNWPFATEKPYVTVTYSDVGADAWGQGIVNNSSYYIINKETGKYLTALSSATGSNITQQEFRDDYASTQQWKFTKASTSAGYNITLANTGKCIKGEYANGIYNVALGTTGSSISHQIWRPYRNWNGTYHLQIRSSPSGSMSADEMGDNVFHTLYTCDLDHYDEWTLIPVNKGEASFFDFDINDIDTTYGTETMTDIAETLGGFSAANRITNGTADNGYQALQNDALFYYSGHGSPGKLNFMNTDENGQNYSQGDLIVSNDLRKIPLDRSIGSLSSNSLAQSQLVILASCLSGADAVTESDETIDENMTGRLYWLGAHNVISYFHETYQDYDLAWNSAFMTEIMLGRSLKTAKMRADNHLYDDYFLERARPQYYPYGNTNERHDLGDEKFIPGLTIASAKAARGYTYQDFPSSLSNGGVEKKFALPKDSIVPNAAACANYEFDVYMDVFGGIYWYYANTNVLHSYEPYTENLNLGDVVVNQQEAMELATEFLSTTGYSVAGYQVKTSNAYSKDYTIEFHSPNNESTSPNAMKKYIFHMQSDIYGRIYINSFSAYVENYGNY